LGAVAGSYDDGK